MTSAAERIEACLAEACGALNEAAALHTEASSPFGKDFLYRVGEALAASWEARHVLHAHCPELIPKVVLDLEQPQIEEQFRALVATAVPEGQDQLRRRYAEFLEAAEHGSYLRRVAQLRMKMLGLVP